MARHETDMNAGKRFEEDFKNSVPEWDMIYKLPDAAQMIGMGYSLRYSAKNPFDYLMWDSKRHVLYAFELKTVGDNSISFEREPDESREIHYHQIKGLTEWNEYDGIVCGLIVEFRKFETTVFIDIVSLNKLIDEVPKKSFNLFDLKTMGIKHTIIQQQRRRTRYSYDIEKFLEEMSL